MDFQICTKTIMDTTDPDIKFDAEGVSNHVSDFNKELGVTWFPNEEGSKKLDQLIDEIKKTGKGKEYDAIIGLSGGVDSSYLAYFLKKNYDLRILAVHVDAGWNSELAIHNIEQIVKILNIDLYTYVVNWKEMRDLQLAYLKANVINQDVPQDHIFTAVLKKTAKEKNVKYFLSGQNHATEGILPNAWFFRASDGRNLKDIHAHFGKVSLKSYYTTNIWKEFIYYPFIFGLKTKSPLNYMEYDKEKAKKIISEEINWRDYGGKHGESNFTKFYQNYYLPTKFNVDKRKAHLSSMILSGSITREEALKEIEKPLYDPLQLENDKSYIARKLNISIDEFHAILEQPTRRHQDYKNEEFFYVTLRDFLRKVGGLNVLKKILR
ncbi:MAG TPA: N-acetyl sugar amidotransferase [Saprospiraceae bacterium]|nr:N-acetyl sugar amidotransferase [Saprospiraceae bacterium]